VCIRSRRDGQGKERAPRLEWDGVVIALSLSSAFLLHFPSTSRHPHAPGRLNEMDGEMEVDSPDQRGTKRPVEETESSEPAQPKRIKVGRRPNLKASTF
jgi:hypothetical protein